MKITLNEDDLKQAVTDFVSRLCLNKDAVDLEIAFSGGRSPNGFSAEVDVQPRSEEKGYAGIAIGGLAVPPPTPVAMDETKNDEPKSLLEPVPQDAEVPKKATDEEARVLFN